MLSSHLLKTTLIKNIKFLTTDSLNSLLKLAELKELDFVSKLGNERLHQIVHYNVPTGKLWRGNMLVSTYNAICTDRKDSNDVKVEMLGWCIEWLQTFFLLIDDVMDFSEFRRGKKCWYKQDNVGMSVFNDAFVLETSIYHSLNQLFHEDNDLKLKIIELFKKISYITSFGQNTDFYLSNQKHLPFMERFTLENYKKLVEYKTSWYTFVFPVMLAHTFVKKPFNKCLENLLLDIGYYFQIQDDYLDCFGDTAITGKSLCDIIEGKCCWPIVKCLQICSPTQAKALELNYGNNSIYNDKTSLEIVKSIYNSQNVDLSKKYQLDSQILEENIRLKLTGLNDDKMKNHLNKIMESLRNRQK